mmetsp:Transcript_55423/g.87915  ORF Transcript_55423/g.87915 Transcript_55423/m.87915 type:complete len:141 (-) Transcript_55423:257-679(-)
MGCRSSKATAAPFPSLAESNQNDSAKAEVEEPTSVDAATPLEGAAPMEPIVEENLDQEPKSGQTDAATQESKDEGKLDALMTADANQTGALSDLTPAMKLDGTQNFAEHKEEDDLQQQQQTKDALVEVAQPQTSGWCSCK